MSILITGATGNVGAEVVKRLVGGGYSVRAAVRGGDPTGLPPGVAAVPFDFDRPETFGPTLDGVERVFLVRPPAISDVKRTLNPFVDAVRDAGARHIVFLSLLGAASNPVVPHASVEKHLRASGLEWTFLRPSFFMQNLTGAHRAEIRDRDEIYIPAGDGSTSFIDARDIAAVAAKALTEDGHVNRAYDLTGAEALTYGEVAAILSEELGRPIRYADPSPLGFALRRLRNGDPLPYVFVLLGIYATARFGKAATVTNDLRTLLDREPITLCQFARDYRACWMR